MMRKGSVWHPLNVQRKMRVENAPNALVGITWMKMGTVTLDVMASLVMIDCYLITMGVKANAFSVRVSNFMSIQTVPLRIITVRIRIARNVDNKELGFVIGVRLGIREKTESVINVRHQIA